jgi:hypothetical protein
MSEETVLIAVLCLVVGFLLRGELLRFRKRGKNDEGKRPS